MVNASEHNNVNIIQGIDPSEENGMQDDGDICEYDNSTIQQKPLFELHGISNVILKDRQKKSYTVCTF